MGNSALLSDPAERRFEDAPEIVGAPTGKLWYHGNIEDSAAEQRLKTAAEQDGNYLVYDLCTRAGPVHGNYILLVYYRSKLHRWKISRKQDDGRFILGELNKTSGMVESYASVRELIKAHRGLNGKPLMLENNGGSVKLTRDYITYRTPNSGTQSVGQSQQRRNSTGGNNRPDLKRPAPIFRQRANTQY